MISSFFLLVWRASGAPNKKEKRVWVRWRVTQGGGLAALPWARGLPSFQDSRQLGLAFH